VLSIFLKGLLKLSGIGDGSEPVLLVGEKYVLYPYWWKSSLGVRLGGGGEPNSCLDRIVT
jgi:hypothetical protein